MRLEQASFASGEISPLLHARTDLAKYHTALAELVNMIVLPQGGITRRACFSNLGVTQNSTNGTYTVKLIPFEYNSTDSELLEFGDRHIRVLQKSAEGYSTACTIDSPYTIKESGALRYVQSGNVMFLVHRDHKPQMLVRSGLTSWSIDDMPYSGGPWISGSEWNADAVLTIDTTVNSVHSNKDIFSAGMAGTLLKVEYPVRGTSTTIGIPGQTEAIEVKGTLNVMTAGEWRGEITIWRKASGSSWLEMRKYMRTDKDKQGQWDITITETEDYVLYRVIAAEYTDEETEETEPVFHAATENDYKVFVSSSGFLKQEIYKITQVYSERSVKAELQTAVEGADAKKYYANITLWSIGAWGEAQGYPSSCAMYQDRLILAGSRYQPQTIWMSRTGSYADFGTSDPLRDDDAVTMTLAGSNADRIHSLLSAGDLLVFTTGGEWKIKGSGDSGAITPTALAAHQQTNIGTKDIQPLVAGGHVILVQSQGRKVYALGYDLNIDGYTGSELSILSGHIFEGAAIVDMAYQKEPDSLLWFALEDGTCAVCTYNPEHEVIGWSRQEFPAGKIKAVCALSDEAMTRIFTVCDTGGNDGTQKKLYMSRDRRTESWYTDAGLSFESRMRTLRLNAGSEDGSMFTAKKLAARLVISALKTGEMWAAPGDCSDSHSWERRRKVDAGNTEYLTDAELQLDNGFSSDASIQIRSIGNNPMTIAAITPLITAGG